MSKYATTAPPASADAALRPLAAPTLVGEFAITLRAGALRCTGCGRIFRQHDIRAQAFDEGIRFICEGCGLDALEIAPS